MDALEDGRGFALPRHAGTPPQFAGTAQDLPCRVPEYVPPAWTRPKRDVALDMLRGLAVAILVVNHLHFDSPLEDATSALLSAAEVLVGVSGVVAGMVFGRRWRERGARATTAMLLARARTLYTASVAVVAIVGALTLLPGAATDALTLTRGIDTYDHDGVMATILAVLALEAGPWQFNIMGFFVAMLAVTPALLWALERRAWAAVLAGSCLLYAAGRAWPVDVLPSQSERPFSFTVWQVLFVCGLVAGWHRERIARSLPRWFGAAVLGVAAVAAYARLGGPGTGALLGGDWQVAHFDKDSLDPWRIVTMASVAGAAYMAFRRWQAPLERTLGRLLLPLGRNSFYVFIMQVFVCLAAASIPVLADDGLGRAGNVAAQLGCLGLLWLMISRRFLFRWVPR